ncbi:hypothetical protein [Shewanella colwelliana]|uniref:hypothetical protein n=1 Tax=Shewanella colwelliana TaxID=23 RepID=UPI0022AF8514|nr:hypothetical protein [Shewanella colwelliana]MCZ4337623.1 hypothetical protein [Shewanella colwelliana]
MNLNRTYQFVGHLTTLEPLTVTLKGATVGKTHKMPRNGDLGYFPASSFRGALRHLAHKLVNDVLKAQNDGQPVLDLPEMLMLAQGYFVKKEDMEQLSKSAKSTSTPVDQNLHLRLQNPMISLFGRWGLNSKLGMGSAYTTRIEDTQVFHGGARTVLFERSPELLDDLTSDDVDRFYSFIAAQAETSVDVSEIKKERGALVKSLKTATNDEKDAINAQINDLDAQIKARKDSEVEATESLRRPLDGIEAIKAGIELKHRMAINDANPVELGLFLTTLAKFARNPRLGGNTKLNFGHVHASWTISTWLNEDDFELTEIGRVSIDDSGIKIEDLTDEGLLKNAIEDWKAASSSGKLNFKQYI